MTLRRDSFLSYKVFGIGLLLAIVFSQLKTLIGTLGVFLSFIVFVGFGVYFLLSYIFITIKTDGNGVNFERFGNALDLVDIDSLESYVESKKIGNITKTKIDIKFSDRKGTEFTIPYNMYNKKEFKEFLDFCFLNYPDIDIVNHNQEEFKIEDIR